MVSNINTKQKSNFHLPLPRLTIYQKGVCYFGPKVFNSLLSHIKNLFFANTHKFRRTVKDFLLTNTYYSLEELFNTNSTYDLHLIPFYSFILISSQYLFSLMHFNFVIYNITYFSFFSFYLLYSLHWLVEYCGILYIVIVTLLQ
jgi:hypothetical protein